MKQVLILVVNLFCASLILAQTALPSFSFFDQQKSYPRINEAFNRKQDTLVKQFKEKGLAWPVKYIYLRSFKYDSQLEVWVKYSNTDSYKFFKSYKVCALSGSLGPKRMQGDYQVPEGFYYINEFNPKSVYHLSLGLNYPNASDRFLADSLQPGGDIYIHGSCVTTGCIPITNEQIEELYILAAHAKNNGQDFIPVHIFPVNFKNQKSVNYLTKFLKDYPEYNPLVNELKQAYLYFDKTKQLPLILINKKGEYIVQSKLPAEDEVKNKPIRKKAPKSGPVFNEEEIAKVVNKSPEFPGGIEKFQEFIDKVSREMSVYLQAELPKAYVMIEFIIDKNGKPSNARVIKGGNEELNEKLEEAFDKMPDWTPATRLDKNVNVRLKQSIYIEKTNP